jgi:hypothetical protein
MGSQENEVPFSASNTGYLKYRIYDSTNTYDTGSNLFLQYQSDLRNAINKWDTIVSPNTTVFNSSPYYYTHEIKIDIDIKDFAVDHDTQMDIFLTNYVYFGFPASYGWTFPTAGKFEIDYEFIEEVKNKTRDDGKSSLYYLFLHGIGHLLGIGTLWRANLSNDHLVLQTEDDGEEAYYYKKSSNAFNKYAEYYPISSLGYVGVPVEDNGGEGTANHHFEIGVSNNGFMSTDDRSVGGVLHRGINATEVMTVWTKDLTIPQYISKISVGILHDIGYEVNYAMADTQYVGDPGTEISWLTIDYSNYPGIGQDVESTKALLNSIITDTNYDTDGNPINYNVTVYGMTFTGADSDVLGQAAWSTGEIWLNVANSGSYGLNGVSVSQDVAVLFHEILHVLGCIGVGERGGQFINDKNTRPYNTYKGTHGVTQYRKVLTTNNIDITHMQENLFPLEDDYGYGTETFHFEEDIVRHRWINGIYYNTVKNEIMTGILNGNNFITSMTLGALEDLGFTVDYQSSDVVDSHSDLSISTKPVTYISQLNYNLVEAVYSRHYFNEETNTSNYIGLNVGKYILQLTGTQSSWSHLGFHLPSSSTTSAHQEIFIDEDYPETTVESTSTLSGLSYTLYSGAIEIEVTGDFGMITMYNGFTSRNITFDRAAPRYEKLIFSEGWEMFGSLDIKVGMTLNWNENTESIHKFKSEGEGYETTSGNTLMLVPGNNNHTYWLNSAHSNQVNLLVEYTMENEVTYESGHEINISVKSGLNHFGTLIKKMTLSASNDETLIKKSSLLMYDTVHKQYKSVPYETELDSKVGYYIEANGTGTIKAILS